MRQMLAFERERELGLNCKAELGAACAQGGLFDVQANLEFLFLFFSLFYFFVRKVNLELAKLAALYTSAMFMWAVNQSRKEPQ